MTIDLIALVANALWGFVLVVVEIAGKTRHAGARWNAGNRDSAPAFPAWIARTGRALRNHQENFPLFLTAVVAVHLAGRADGVSATASVGYAVARVAYSGLYIAGVTGLRSVVWLAGTAAVFVVFSRLVG